MTLSDSELDDMGRVNPKDIGCTPLEMGIHEWSEWVEIHKPSSLGFGIAKLKIRICKRCKQLQGDLV